MVTLVFNCMKAMHKNDAKEKGVQSRQVLQQAKFKNKRKRKNNFNSGKSVAHKSRLVFYLNKNCNSMYNKGSYIPRP